MDMPNVNHDGASCGKAHKPIFKDTFLNNKAKRKLAMEAVVICIIVREL